MIARACARISRPAPSPSSSRTSRARRGSCTSSAPRPTRRRSPSIGGVIREACARARRRRGGHAGRCVLLRFPDGARGVEPPRPRLTEALAAGPIQVRVGLHTGTPLLDRRRATSATTSTSPPASRPRATAARSSSPRATAELVEALAHRPRRAPAQGHRARRSRSSSSGAAHSRRSRRSRTRTSRGRRAPSSGGIDELAEVLSRIEARRAPRHADRPGRHGQDAARDRGGVRRSSPSTRRASSGSDSPPLRDPALVTETIAQTLGAKDGLAEHIGERRAAAPARQPRAGDRGGARARRAPRRVPQPDAARHQPRAPARAGRGRVRRCPHSPSPRPSSLFCERVAARADARRSQSCARASTRCRSRSSSPPRARRRSRRADPRAPLGRLDLLKGGRDADPRQQTLRATIEWSYDLLTAEEQQLFARLSVFAGGCTLEAAEEVARPTSTPCSRSSRRASFASRTSATGCSRRSGSTRSSGSTSQARRTRGDRCTPSGTRASPKRSNGRFGTTPMRRWRQFGRARQHARGAGVCVRSGRGRRRESYIAGLWFYWLTSGRGGGGNHMGAALRRRAAGARGASRSVPGRRRRGRDFPLRRRPGDGDEAQARARPDRARQP